MAPIEDPENTLIIVTTKGNVVIAMRPDLAPRHVERIKQLAREGFYDGIVFHRVIDGSDRRWPEAKCRLAGPTQGRSCPNGHLRCGNLDCRWPRPPPCKGV